MFPAFIVQCAIGEKSLRKVFAEFEEINSGRYFLTSSEAWVDILEYNFY